MNCARTSCTSTTIIIIMQFFRPKIYFSGVSCNSGKKTILYLPIDVNNNYSHVMALTYLNFAVQKFC